MEQIENRPQGDKMYFQPDPSKGRARGHFAKNGTQKVRGDVFTIVTGRPKIEHLVKETMKLEGKAVVSEFDEMLDKIFEAKDFTDEVNLAVSSRFNKFNSLIEAGKVDPRVVLVQVTRYLALTKSDLDTNHFVKLYRLLNTNQPDLPSVSAEIAYLETRAYEGNPSYRIGDKVRSFFRL